MRTEHILACHRMISPPQMAKREASAQPVDAMVPSGQLESRAGSSLLYPERTFRALVFDWDGTAVVDRRADASDIARVVTDLLGLGVWVVVVTGTNFGNIDRQFVSLIDLSEREKLLVCTNRGSEVYGFGLRGGLLRRSLRLATPEEDRALTVIADEVRNSIVAQTGLTITVVADRLNRRKIDLIPLQEWRDPPKAIIERLLLAVEERLRGAGLAGGLGDVLAFAEKSAQEHGLRGAVITTDVKHVEVGLTGKGESVDWVQREILRPHGIEPEEVLICGDEFGPLAGRPGSDAMMLIPAIMGATVVSVGREPNGLPRGVIHMGGGPARFRTLLREQVALISSRTAGTGPAPTLPVTPVGDHARWVTAAVTLPVDPAWRLVEDGYKPELEHEIESRFAVANGFLGVRASLEVPTAASRPRTYVAGLFETPAEPFASPTFVAGPDWQRFSVCLEEQALSLETGGTASHVRALDLARGALISQWGHQDATGRTTWVRTVRTVSIADRSIGIFIAQVTPPHGVRMTVESWVEPPAPSLTLVHTDQAVSVWRSKHTGAELAVATTARLRVGKHEVEPVRDVGSRLCWTLGEEDRAATLARITAVARGGHGTGAAQAAEGSFQRARRRGLRRLLADHERAWAARWEASDIALEGDEASQSAIRFAVYHLNSAANPDDDRVSIGARGLSGDGYRGHVFWDTETFMLPFYIFTWPQAARALLMYRFHTIPAARSKALRLGYRGALYAWESTDTGDETTPPFVIAPNGAIVPVKCGTDEHHISADIAYAVWTYWEATGDARFLLEAGAEILIETARFWASRAELGADKHYHIRGIIGPDEYHEGVDDNAYTNVMAQWNLERGIEVTALLRRRWPSTWSALTGRLRLEPDEVDLWGRVARRMFSSFEPATGLYEQFSGFFDLEEIDVAAQEPRSAPMDIMLGRERTQRSQVVKQADVVMLMALLKDRFPEAVRRANFSYYEPRCGHGSSLSPPIHALVAARLGDTARAQHYFSETAAIDLDDTMGNAAHGVHLGALGGLWQATVFGFGGLSAAPDGLRLAPRLPEGWRELRFPVQWRGRKVRIVVQQDPPLVTATLERGRPLPVAIGPISWRLRRGESISVRYDPGAGSDEGGRDE